MNRRLFALTLILGLIAVLTVPAVAQQAGFSIESVDIEGYPEVALTVTVENQLVGAAVPSFRLLEGGDTRPVSVAATASDDLKVVLLLDVSGSMRGAPLSGAKAAARQFIDAMPSGVEIAVVPFGSSPTLAAEFTDDKQTLLAGIDSLVARGETALYDGVVSAAALLANEKEAGRTIVLLSDGGDTVSGRSLNDAVGALENLGAAFFAIELQSPENDREALEALAAAASGSVVSADDPAVLADTFGDIASKLLSSYRLVFTAESFDLAEVDVLAVVDTVVVASARRVIELPPDPAAIEPGPAPVEDADIKPEPDPLPEPRPGVAIALSWLETGSARLVGVAAIFLAAALAFTTIALRSRAPREARGRSTLTMTPSARAQAKRTPLTAIAESATVLAEKALTRGDRFSSLNTALERAGVALRPGEFIVLIGSTVLGAIAIGLIFLGPAFGLLFGAIVVLPIPLWLSSKRQKRSDMFNEQLGDTLQLMSASMRAGYGLMQAVDAVAEEAPSPTAEEFQRIKIETHLGRDLDDSLQAAAGRVDSEDFRWVAEAIQIHRQIGGDLGEILDAVNETIRDRNRIRRRIKALSAEGRISAVILSMIPLVLALVITFINPSYIGELPKTGMGQVLIVGGIIAWVISVFWMRRIVRLIF